MHRIRMTKVTADIIVPAIASPLGVLNSPTNEKIAPSTHSTHEKIGIQHISNEISARINPAMPIPLYGQ